MSKEELATFIAEFIITEKEIILEGIKKEDFDIIRDEAYEYLENCIY